MEIKMLLNLIFVAILSFWAFYRAHITKRAGSRLGYSMIVFAGAIVILSTFVRDDSNFLKHQTVSWQSLFLHFTLAIFCLINLWQYHLSGEFKQAFIKKSKEKNAEHSTIY